eukprot:TRINITY_DN21548_c1_g1_i1.p1 TRINITY_DN21548_c1_g1~~TRINITY_DN21548_c1_g1_i1.p1  ORF type:complete len:255 (+),score=58.68 TRINITY_DN21548_c1_g1_i1:170-934(+)
MGKLGTALISTDIWTDGPYTPLPAKIEHDVLIDREKQPNWLVFDEPSNILEDTDINSTDWVASRKAECTEHSINPKHVWYHPSFKLKDEQHALHVELTEIGSKNRRRRKLWDVIFAGRPGDDREVPRFAPPAGGKRPLFPMFCPPLKADVEYELRLAEPNNDDDEETLETLILRPNPDLPQEWVQPSVPKKFSHQYWIDAENRRKAREDLVGPSKLPKPILTLDAESGPVDRSGQHVDPETGELVPDLSTATFL